MLAREKHAFGMAVSALQNLIFAVIFHSTAIIMQYKSISLFLSFVKRFFKKSSKKIKKGVWRGGNGKIQGLRLGSFSEE